MIELKVNVSQEVNEAQYNHIRTIYKGYAAHRKEAGKFFIKFLTFVHLKKALIEEELNKLA